jgi:hypothetical protein
MLIWLAVREQYQGAAVEVSDGVRHVAVLSGNSRASVALGTNAGRG